MYAKTTGTPSSSSEGGSDAACVVEASSASPRALWLGDYDGYTEHLKEDYIEYKTRRDKDGELVVISGTVVVTLHYQA